MLYRKSANNDDDDDEDNNMTCARSVCQSLLGFLQTQMHLMLTANLQGGHYCVVEETEAERQGFLLGVT